MKQSLSFYITLFILKLAGLKKGFSKSPVDYKKIRKADSFNPKGSFFKKRIQRKFSLLKTEITEIAQIEAGNKLILYIHGGAFISGPSKIHWDNVRAINEQTKQTVWLCNYPKAPESKIAEISKNIDAVYNEAIKQYDSKNIILIGDSVGGTLITALVQRLIKNNVKLPHKIILISPVMDSTMTNPEIDVIDKTDPMLAKTGILSAKKMCAENNDLADPRLSPLNGSFAGFPKTIIFAGTNDIMFPDEKIAIQKFRESNVELEVIEGENMPHIWPILPVMKEAKLAFSEIINGINN